MSEETKAILEECVKLCCEICYEPIGTVGLNLAFPMTSEMFGSPDEIHGYPPPFDDGQTWEYFRCPHCRYRPMIFPDRILTNKGPMEVKPRPESPPEPVTEEEKPDNQDFQVYNCTVCGKPFGTERELRGHMVGAHKSKRNKVLDTILEKGEQE